MAGARRALQSFAQQTQYFAIGTTTLTGIFEEYDVVEGCTEHAREFAQIFITTVTGTANHDRAFHSMVRGQRVKGCDQRTHGMRVVSVISDHRGIAVVHEVESTRRVFAVVMKAVDATDDVLPVHAESPAGTDGGQRVLDLKS